MFRRLMQIAAIAGAGYAWRKFRNRRSGQNAYESDRNRFGSTSARQRGVFGSERRMGVTERRTGAPASAMAGMGVGTGAGTGAGFAGGSSYGTAGSSSSYSTGAGSGAGTGSLAGSGTSGMTGGGGVGSSSIRSDFDDSADVTPRR